MFQPKVVFISLTVALLSGCVVAPYPYARQPGYDAAGYGESTVVVDMPPPAPYAEAIPVAPFLGALWISGYWGWGGGRHQWVPGRWEQPRAGYGWRPHAWAQQGGRWHLHAGGWYRR